MFLFALNTSNYGLHLLNTAQPGESRTPADYAETASVEFQASKQQEEKKGGKFAWLLKLIQKFRTSRAWWAWIIILNLIEVEKMNLVTFGTVYYIAEPTEKQNTPSIWTCSILIENLLEL